MLLIDIVPYLACFVIMVIVGVIVYELVMKQIRKVDDKAEKKEASLQEQKDVLDALRLVMHDTLIEVIGECLDKGFTTKAERSRVSNLATCYFKLHGNGDSARELQKFDALPDVSDIVRDKPWQYKDFLIASHKWLSDPFISAMENANNIPNKEMTDAQARIVIETLKETNNSHEHETTNT